MSHQLKLEAAWDKQDANSRFSFVRLQACSHGGRSGAIIPKLFVPPNFVVQSKICFKHSIKTEILHPYNVFCLSKH